ncbi:MAG TPA: hybrid sensor histidine kinase/response regulator [Candidatus Limnocylindria bacterium]|nr:hybrid sensor histidine kinase/response regulator [Candidatus Limnocylindria bacterium]
MMENSIFESYLAQNGYALFEFLGGGEFRALGSYPDWCKAVWGAQNARQKTLRLAEQSPFLENFLVDAEGFWNSKRDGAANSSVWIERDSSNRETPLEAWAVRLDGKKILIVRNLSSSYAERQQLFQTARNSLLEHEQLLREIQKKEILLHCIIHDLSQPLNAMRGCFNLLSMENLPGEQQRMIEAGQRESQRQEQMIRGILEAFSGELAVQQGSAGTTAETPDLVACAQRVVEQFSPAFLEKGIRLQLDPRLDVAHGWKVVGDASRLERIFGNLLENAMRYTPKGSGVTVGIEDKVHCLLAFVDDEGPGLPKDANSNRLFALFSKGKDRPGKAGLGLYFCKITVERWGGSIGAENRPGGGSRFWFKIPRAMKTTQNRGADKRSPTQKPSPPAAPVAPAAHVKKDQSARLGPGHLGKASRQLQILVAEDTDVNRELVTELLQKRGHSVFAVEDGRAAIAALSKKRFDVVLMDEQMPGMDGLEATRSIRQMERTSGNHQIIIGLTGNVAEEDKQRRIEAGMDGYVTKPFDMQVLFRTIESHSDGGQQAAHAKSDSAGSAASDVDVATHLVRSTGGNQKLAQSLVKSFLADAPKKISDIRHAVAQKDPAKLASAAHAFKGAAAIFGALQAVAAARNLEAMGKAGNSDAAEKEFQTLESEFARLKSELLTLQTKSAAGRPISLYKRKK